MKAAPCSCLVRISLIEELRRLSTTSRFSSPGTPKIRSTPSFSSAATNKSEPFGISISWSFSPRQYQGRRAWPCVSVQRNLAEDCIEQQRFHVERGDCPGTKQIGAVRDDQRAVFGAIGDAAVRAFDQRCIKRDDVHQCTETQFAQQQALADRKFRRRYG